MKISKHVIVLLAMTTVSACSIRSVELQHSEQPEQTKTCRNAFFDWHAASHMVDYYNYHCAQRAIKQGYKLIEPVFAGKDFSIPEAPNGGKWNEALALEALDAERISAQKYGYIIGMLEMEYRATVSEAKNQLEAGKLSKEAFDSIKQDAEDAFYGNKSE